MDDKTDKTLDDLHSFLSAKGGCRVSHVHREYKNFFSIDLTVPDVSNLARRFPGRFSMRGDSIYAAEDEATEHITSHIPRGGARGRGRGGALRSRGRGSFRGASSRGAPAYKAYHVPPQNSYQRIPPRQESNSSFAPQPARRGGFSSNYHAFPPAALDHLDDFENGAPANDPFESRPIQYPTSSGNDDRRNDWRGNDRGGEDYGTHERRSRFNGTVYSRDSASYQDSYEYGRRGYENSRPYEYFENDGYANNDISFGGDAQGYRNNQYMPGMDERRTPTRSFQLTPPIPSRVLHDDPPSAFPDSSYEQWPLNQSPPPQTNNIRESGDRFPTTVSALEQVNVGKKEFVPSKSVFARRPLPISTEDRPPSVQPRSLPNHNVSPESMDAPPGLGCRLSTPPGLPSRSVIPPPSSLTPPDELADLEATDRSSSTSRHPVTKQLLALRTVFMLTAQNNQPIHESQFVSLYLRLHNENIAQVVESKGGVAAVFRQLVKKDPRLTLKQHSGGVSICLLAPSVDDDLPRLVPAELKMAWKVSSLIRDSSDGEVTLREAARAMKMESSEAYQFLSSTMGDFFHIRLNSEDLSKSRVSCKKELPSTQHNLSHEEVSSRSSAASAEGSRRIFLLSPRFRQLDELPEEIEVVLTQFSSFAEFYVVPANEASKARDEMENIKRIHARRLPIGESEERAEAALCLLSSRGVARASLLYEPNRADRNKLRIRLVDFGEELDVQREEVVPLDSAFSAPPRAFKVAIKGLRLDPNRQSDLERIEKEFKLAAVNENAKLVIFPTLMNQNGAVECGVVLESPDIHSSTHKLRLPEKLERERVILA